MDSYSHHSSGNFSSPRSTGGENSSRIPVFSGSKSSKFGSSTRQSPLQNRFGSSSASHVKTRPYYGDNRHPSSLGGELGMSKIDFLNDDVTSTIMKSLPAGTRLSNDSLTILAQSLVTTQRTGASSPNVTRISTGYNSSTNVKRSAQLTSPPQSNPFSLFQAEDAVSRAVTTLQYMGASRENWLSFSNKVSAESAKLYHPYDLISSVDSSIAEFTAAENRLNVSKTHVNISTLESGSEMPPPLRTAVFAPSDAHEHTTSATDVRLAPLHVHGIGSSLVRPSGALIALVEPQSLKPSQTSEASDVTTMNPDTEVLYASGRHGVVISLEQYLSVGGRLSLLLPSLRGEGVNFSVTGEQKYLPSIAPSVKENPMLGLPSTGGLAGPNASGRQQRLYNGHLGDVTAVAAHPFLPLAATAEMPSPGRPSAEIHLWNVRTCVAVGPVLRIAGPPGVVVSNLSFSVDGRFVAAMTCAVLGSSSSQEDAAFYQALLLFDTQAEPSPDTSLGPSLVVPSSELRAPEGKTAERVAALDENGELLNYPTARRSSLAHNADSWNSPDLEDLANRNEMMSEEKPDFLLLSGPSVLILSVDSRHPALPQPSGLIAPSLVKRASSHASLNDPALSSSTTTASTKFPVGSDVLIVSGASDGSLVVRNGGRVLAKLCPQVPADHSIRAPLSEDYGGGSTNPIGAVTALCAVPVRPLSQQGSAPESLLACAFSSGFLAVVHLRMDSSSSDNYSVRIIDVLPSGCPAAIAGLAGAARLRADRRRLSVQLGLLTRTGQIFRVSLALIPSENGRILDVVPAVQISSLRSLSSHSPSPSHRPNAVGAAQTSKEGGECGLVLDLLEGVPATTVLLAGRPLCVTTHPSLPLYAVGHADGSIAVWDLEFHVLVGFATIPPFLMDESSHSTAQAVVSLQFAADGITLFCATGSPCALESAREAQASQDEILELKRQAKLAASATSSSASHTGGRIAPTPFTSEVRTMRTQRRSDSDLLEDKYTTVIGSNSSSSSAHSASGSSFRGAAAVLQLLLPPAYLAALAARSSALELSVRKHLLTQYTLQLAACARAARAPSVYPHIFSLDAEAASPLPELTNPLKSLYPDSASSPVLHELHALCLQSGLPAQALLPQFLSSRLPDSLTLASVIPLGFSPTVVAVAPPLTPPGGASGLPGRTAASLVGSLTPAVARGLVEAAKLGSGPIADSPVIADPSFILTVALGGATGGAEVLVLDSAASLLGGVFALRAGLQPLRLSSPAAVKMGILLSSAVSSSSTDHSHPHASHAHGYGLQGVQAKVGTTFGSLHSSVENARANYALQRRKQLFPPPRKHARAMNKVLRPEERHALTCSPVVAADWDAQGRYLVITNASYELVAWEAASGLLLRSLEPLRDLAMHTHSSPLAWGSLGLWSDFLVQQQEFSRELAKRKTKGLPFSSPSKGLATPLSVSSTRRGLDFLLAGGADGDIRVYKYPARPQIPVTHGAPHPMTIGSKLGYVAPAARTRAQFAPVRALAVSCDDSAVVTVTPGALNAVQVWSLECSPHPSHPSSVTSRTPISIASANTVAGLLQQYYSSISLNNEDGTSTPTTTLPPPSSRRLSVSEELMERRVDRFLDRRLGTTISAIEASALVHGPVIHTEPSPTMRFSEPDSVEVPDSLEEIVRGFRRAGVGAASLQASPSVSSDGESEDAAPVLSTVDPLLSASAEASAAAETAALLARMEASAARIREEALRHHANENVAKRLKGYASPPPGFPVSSGVVRGAGRARGARGGRVVGKTVGRTPGLSPDSVPKLRGQNKIRDSDSAFITNPLVLQEEKDSPAALESPSLKTLDVDLSGDLASSSPFRRLRSSNSIGSASKASPVLESSPIVLSPPPSALSSANRAFLASLHFEEFPEEVKDVIDLDDDLQAAAAAVDRVNEISPSLQLHRLEELGATQETAQESLLEPSQVQNEVSRQEQDSFAASRTLAAIELDMGNLDLEQELAQLEEISHPTSFSSTLVEKEFRAESKEEANDEIADTSTVDVGVRIRPFPEGLAASPPPMPEAHLPEVTTVKVSRHTDLDKLLAEAENSLIDTLRENVTVQERTHKRLQFDEYDDDVKGIE